MTWTWTTRGAQRLACVVVVAAVASAAVALATVVVAVGFVEQCRQAHRIFVGTVTSVESRRNPSAPRFFETLVTFAVDRVVAGDVGSESVLRFSGGRVGDERQSIDGMPEFAAGERYVVFVEADGGAPLVSPIVGFDQGLYSVVPVTRNGTATDVVRDRHGRPLAIDTSTGRAALATAEGAPEPDVSTFIAAIHAARAE